MDETIKPQRDTVASTKLIIGIFFAVVGVLMTAANLGWWEAEHLLSYWPAVIILVGLVKVFEPGRWMVGTVIAAIGLVILAGSAGWLRVSIFDLWPILLILFGGAMVARALGFRPEAALGGATSSGNDVWAILSTRKLVNDSPEFRGTRLSAVMSGIKLDLTRAGIAQSPAVIDCFAMWAGIEIHIPETWDVIGEVVPFMGGFEVRTSPVADPRKQLIVRGTAVMAGIEVKRKKELSNA